MVADNKWLPLEVWKFWQGSVAFDFSITTVHSLRSAKIFMEITNDRYEIYKKKWQGNCSETSLSLGDVTKGQR